MNELKTHTLSKSAAEELGRLAQANFDSFKVLTEAADCMNDPTTGDILRKVALRRGKNAEQLRFLIRDDSDDDVQQRGTLGGSFHQVWIDVRAAINAGDTYVMLLEAEKAEKAISQAYAAAMDSVGDEKLRRELDAQRRLVEGDSDIVAELKANMGRIRRSSTTLEHP